MNTYIRLLVIFTAFSLTQSIPITAAQLHVTFHNKGATVESVNKSVAPTSPIAAAPAIESDFTKTAKPAAQETAVTLPPSIVPAALVRTSGASLETPVNEPSLEKPSLGAVAAQAPPSPALTSVTPAPAKKASDQEEAINYWSKFVARLSFSPLPDIPRHSEQIIGLSLVQRAQDTAKYYSVSHENYLKEHVESQTLAVVLPTADAQRSKFGHAANELIQKAAERQAKNTIVRMGKLIKGAEAHDIALNEADLKMMKQQTILQLQDALATLALINSKVPMPENPTPFDMVGKKSKEEHKA